MGRLSNMELDTRIEGQAAPTRMIVRDEWHDANSAAAHLKSAKRTSFASPTEKAGQHARASAACAAGALAP